MTKALVLAAGLGSRLGDLTKDKPKPLMEFGNTTVLARIIKQLRKAKVRNVALNLHYKADKVLEYFDKHSMGVRLNCKIEKELSGSAGGLRLFKKFFEKEEFFIVMPGDVVTDVDLLYAIEQHRLSNDVVTMGIKRVYWKELCKYGVVLADDYGKVLKFQEKPSIHAALSDYINTGIYVFSNKVFDYIGEGFQDFAKDVFPRLVEERLIGTFYVEDYWNDIGTPDTYEKALQDLENGKVKRV